MLGPRDITLRDGSARGGLGCSSPPPSCAPQALSWGAALRHQTHSSLSFLLVFHSPFADGRRREAGEYVTGSRHEAGSPDSQAVLIITPAPALAQSQPAQG